MKCPAVLVYSSKYYRKMFLLLFFGHIEYLFNHFFLFFILDEDSRFPEA